MRGLLIGVAIFFAVAAPARAGDAVVMLSDSGDYIGGGIARIYHPANSQITVSGSTAYLTVGVSGGGTGDAFHMDFAAPPGQSLAPGVYDRAQRAAFREAGRPGIDIGGDGRGCNTIEGRFEVRDFAVTAEGHLQRLWIVYEQHCEGGSAALYGEVRLGTGGAAAPAILRWPMSDMGRGGAASPVTLIAPDHLAVSGVALAGEHPGDFVVRADECSGRTLVPGGSCQVWVRYVPTTPGTRTALLRISDTAGRVHESALQGFSYGGSTRLHMVSDEGDYIGAGATWDYTPANDRIALGGSRRYVGFSIDGATGDWWYGTFAAPEGDILTTGRYAPASRYPFNGSGAGMDISGNGRGCNELSGEFTITEITFNEDGTVRTFGADFEQHCEHMTPALRGTVEWRKGDTTPPPPWTVSGPGSTAPVTHLTTPGAPPPGTAPPTDPAAGAPAAAPATPAPGPCEAGRYARRRLVAGTSAADVLRGTARAERLLGGDGDDRGYGRGGRDCLQGGSGRDRLSGGASNDLLYGGDDADLLSGGSGADLLSGGGGADVLSGGSGRDRLSGGPGDDKLVGGAGADRMHCGAGRDVVHVTRGDRVRGCERRTRARRTR